jgi:general secretion pathway protein F
LTTRVILAMSDGLRDDWWMLSAIIGALALVAHRYAVTPDGRRLRDSLLLRLPIVGELVTKIEIARFGRTLGTLMRNGVSPLAALSITQETVSNAVLREDLASVVESVRQGHGFAEPLAQAPWVPALAAKLARVGEETARLDDMLLKIAEIFESDTRRSIERLLALLVPAITIGLGVIVALVIGSILSAVLSVYNLAV